jgi:acetyltransferase
MALVVEHKNPQTAQREIIGVARLTKLPGREAEFAIVISDSFQRQGLGVELLSRLVKIGQDEKLRLIKADILPENRGMQRVSQTLGFHLRSVDDGRLVRAELNLEA